MTEFSHQIGATSALFSLVGEQGAVVFRLGRPFDRWQPLFGSVHRRASRGQTASPGECDYLDGPCHAVQIKPDRLLVPVIKWVRRDQDPETMRRYLERWYREYIQK